MRNNRYEEIIKLIDSSQSFYVTGIPGMGISLFLKSLSEQSVGKLIYIDVFSMSEYSAKELIRSIHLALESEESPTDSLLISCKSKLLKMCDDYKRIVICLAGFDQLENKIEKKLLYQLRALKNVNREKIVLIFGICKQMKLIVSELIDADLSIISSAYYLKPYSHDELLSLIDKYGPRSNSNSKQLDELIKLSGGHFQLLQLLLRAERSPDTKEDPFIQLVLKNIYQHLDHKQKKILQHLVLKKRYSSRDVYLEAVGLIKSTTSDWDVFSPLFKNYILSTIKLKLPKKEKELFKVLKKNLGNIVMRREIFDIVWKDDAESASDWALDALVYRLRKHPAFISSGYFVENYKKQGYQLIESSS